MTGKFVQKNIGIKGRKESISKNGGLLHVLYNIYLFDRHWNRLILSERRTLISVCLTIFPRGWWQKYSDYMTTNNIIGLIKPSKLKQMTILIVIKSKISPFLKTACKFMDLSLNFKNLVRMSVMLHKHYTLETCFVHINLLQKGTRTVAISFEFLPVFQKAITGRYSNDIVTFQVSFCNKYMSYVVCKDNTFSMYHFYTPCIWSI